MQQENKKVIMYDLDKNDNIIEETKRIGWDSRALATLILLTTKDHSQFILERRGPGCPDEIGKYVFPCGYLSWGENLQEAAAREVYEEIGIKLNPEKLKLFGINDRPIENRQNVTVRFVYELEGDDWKNLLDIDSLSRGGEADEVDEIVIVDANWILSNRDKMGFNHDIMLEDFLKVANKLPEKDFYFKR